jgi:hypothetical protein
MRTSKIREASSIAGRSTKGVFASLLEKQLHSLLPDKMRNVIMERMLSTMAAPGTSAYDLETQPSSGLDLRWPEDVAPKEVAEWLLEHAQDLAEAERLRDAIKGDIGHDWATSAMARLVAPASDAASTLPGTDPVTLACVVTAQAFRAWRAIQQDLRRPMIAVDAGRQHHNFVCGIRDLPKDRTPRKAKVIDGRVEILAPDGRSVQLLLPLDGEGGLHRATIETLRQWRGWEGVRHWAALQRLVSVEGGRSGSVRWTLDAHLDALGYNDRVRRDPAVRQRIAREVELLTRLELAVYAPDGSLRARQPLLVVGTKYDRLQGTTWTLEGMELKVNEWLYRGVRDPKTGKLGTAWHPAPIELAQIDHVRFPYAILLGLILPIRWRWDLGSRDHCVLSGENLLATAGIVLSKDHPGRAWDTLRQNLGELQRRGGLGHYEWEGEAWTETATCRLYPPQWIRDRTLHGLTPFELAPPPAILTGEELLSWRKKRGISQAECAKMLGVSERTIRGAEAKLKVPLTRGLRKAFETASAASTSP